MKNQTKQKDPNRWFPFPSTAIIDADADETLKKVLRNIYIDAHRKGRQHIVNVIIHHLDTVPMLPTERKELLNYLKTLL